MKQTLRANHKTKSINTLDLVSAFNEPVVKISKGNKYRNARAVDKE